MIKKIRSCLRHNIGKMLSIAIIGFFIVLIYIIITYIAQDIKDSSLVYTIGALATATSILVTAKIYEREKYRQSVKEAVEIAKIAQSHLLFSFGFVERAYSELGLDKITLSDKFMNLSDTAQLRFNGRELASLYPPKTVELYCDKLKSFSTDNMRSIISDQEFSIPVICDSNKIQFDIEALEKAGGENAYRFLEHIEINSLNELEWIAMLLNTGAAADKVIYQSLHQEILKFIKFTYINICLHNLNKPTVDKLYCNLIDMFNRWNLWRINALKRETKALERILKKRQKQRRKMQKQEEAHNEKSVTRSPKI